ncbi:MAG TPA: hypothetical protein VFS08_00745 [Gemmatimonadaceae bacterium]|nr:hypothetical protein [Gemmatimonadaceae bacterium]
MKKLLVLVLALAACRPSPPPATSPAPAGATYGASSARGAVEAFLAAVKAGDLQAISMVWGNEEGPVFEREDRQVLEQRELIMICYLRHDTARVLDQAPSGQPNRPKFNVELTRGDVTRATTMTTARGPSGRWFVTDADVMAVRDFCQRPTGSSPPSR